MEVCLYKEDLSFQWVVELRAMGRRLSIYRSPPHLEHIAEARAKELAHFLSVPLTRKSIEHAFMMREEDRQLVLLGLALLGLQRPGFSHACREASKCLNGEDLYDSFRTSNEGDLCPSPHPPTTSKTE